MKKHPLRMTLIFLVCMLLIMPVLLCIFGFALPAQYTETFLGVLPDKLDRLASSEGPRIIIVGGSSVPFAVKSGLIEAEFPEYTVVDLGLYADIGTAVMLDLLEEELRSGDIVILSPEQSPQALSDYFSAESLWQAIDGRFDLLSRLSSGRYEKLAAAFPVFAGKKCGYFLFGAPEVDGIYARSSFDSYGDIASPLRQANIMSGGFDPNQPIRFDADMISDAFVSLLNGFAQSCANVGAEVYYRFPPMNQSAVTFGEDGVNDYYDRLNALLDFPILGDPNRCVMESGWFYDTNFHLNDSGATVFTQYLIEDLKLLFSDTSPTDIPLPAMPAPQAPIAIVGDDSCADCFTYRQTETGLLIDGLTAKGAAAKELVIPTSCDGQSVVGMEADVFTGNTVIRQLTVQENIATLYDGMFSGCSKLEKLILTGPPGAYTVGDRLRAGADFLICVSDPYLDLFRRHYSWQQYSAWIVAYP